MTGGSPRPGRRDPHAVLGVPRGADRQQVVRAFRLRARQGGHPDIGGDARDFDEIVRARDELLVPAGSAADGPDQRTPPVATPRDPDVDRSTTSPPPRRTGRPGNDLPPREMSPLAIATGVLALLGPLFWPVGIVVGHLALRHIARTGKGGGTFVPVALVFLYPLTLLMLARMLSLVLR